MLLFISTPEIVVVMIIVVMLFGAKKIPEIARGLGQGMRQVKDATNEIKREIQDNVEDAPLKNDFKRISDDIKEIKEDIKESTKPIKRNVDL